MIQVEELLEMTVLVGNAWYNESAEGHALNLRQVWNDHVVVYYAPDQPSLESPSFGYCLRWSGADIPNMQVERHPYESRRHYSEVEIGYYQDERIVVPTLGCVLRNVTGQGAEK